jgi:N-acetylglucosaminyldiphosphoundecaprenol N-acetyl-beta-D-mannosaminyltransferase
MTETFAPHQRPADALAPFAPFEPTREEARTLATLAYPASVLGYRLHPVTKDDILNLASLSASRSMKLVLASQNLHGMYMLQREAAVRELHEADFSVVHLDGMPLVWLGRMAGYPWNSGHRTAWIDWFLDLMQHAEETGLSVFYLGGTEDVLATGLEFLSARFPRLRLAGRNGYFDATPGSDESERVVADINVFRPDILIVGMGMGRQERWILAHRDRLDAGFMATSGACLEYFAGAVPTPPRWLGPLGLEWAFRLLSNPRRFAWRYLVEPLLLAGLLARGRFRSSSDAQAS